MFDRLFNRLAGGIIGKHRWIILVWAILIAVSVPVARQLEERMARLETTTRVLSKTESSETKELLKKALPDASSDRQTILVIKASNVRSDEVKRLLLKLESELEAWKARGKVASYTTPLEIYRRINYRYAREAHKQLYTAVDQMNEVLGPQFTEAQVKDLVLAGMRQRLNLTEDQVWFMGEVAKLGRSPEEADFEALTARSLNRFSLEKFPVEIPSDILGQLSSKDGKLALAAVSFPEKGAYRLQLEELRNLANRTVSAQDARIKVYATSERAISQDMIDSELRDGTKMELFAIALILVVLMIFFRSPIATILTLVMIMLAVIVSKALLYLIGLAGVDLSPVSMSIMTFVMLGAGVDYSMIISERYRQERGAGQGKMEALKVAVARAGESVFFSGMTVLIAFGVTTLSQISWVRNIGFGGLAGILTVLVAALTLTPAILMILGDRFFWPSRPIGSSSKESPFYRYLNATVRFTTRRPLVITLLFVLLLIPGILIVREYKPMANPLVLTPKTESKTGYDLVAEKWGEAWLMPTEVAVRLGSGQVDGGRLTPAALTNLRKFVDRLQKTRGVERVMTVTQPFGKPLSDAELIQMPEFVNKQYLATDGRVVRVSVALRDNPFSKEANSTVDRIRTTVNETRWPGATLSLGGSTLADREYRETLMDNFWRMVALIAAGVFILLALQLRSLVIPLRLILTILLGNVLAIAFLVIVFQWVRNVAITIDMPVMLILLMMGLGLDYEIFLVTRVKEGVEEGMDDRSAVEQAVLKTGRVINFAGLLMAGTLASLTLSSSLAAQALGVALAFAVLLDAIVLRTYLVPATMLLLKKYNWWFPFISRHASAERIKPLVPADDGGEA